MNVSEAARLRVVFMGTPECAAPSLRRLARDGHTLMAVCRPDAARGRGRQVSPPAAKLCAQELAVPVMQPCSINAPDVLAHLSQWQPDLYCIVAYGQILSPEALAIPRLGAVNLHFSLLPRWRGAAPVQHAIWAGDEVTGVTTQFVTAGVDEGDVILRYEIPLGDDVTAGELMAEMAEAGAELLGRTVELVATGLAPRSPQDHTRATYAPRVRPEQAAVDFSQPSRRIVRHIHAFNPAPGCYALFRSEVVKLWRAAIAEGSGQPGEILGIERDALVVASGDGAVAIRQVQPRGRGCQSGRDFANGRRVKPGEMLVRASGIAPGPGRED